jgi:glycine oxidase
MGLAIAHQLARRGRAVTVLSRRRNEAAGFVAAGMLAPHAEGLRGDLLKLGQRSLELVPAWVSQVEADSGLGCGHRPSGIVVPFRSDSERDAYPTARNGLVLERGELEREVSGISSDWCTGLLFEQDGQIDNRRQLMRALERACAGAGVQFEEGAEVQELQQHNGRLTAVALQRADGDRQTLACADAVLCSGAWSAQLLPQLPVFPVKGQMLSLQAPRHALRRVVFGPGTYLVPREDGLVVVGATSEQEAGFSEGLTPEGQKQLQAGIASLLPEAGSWPPMERWWGFRPCTPDEGPLLGPSPVAGLWLACGHHRNGVLLAALTAQLLAGAIAQETPRSTDAALLGAFRWSRFNEGDQPSVRQA